jgi:hypothetical protein
MARGEGQLGSCTPPLHRPRPRPRPRAGPQLLTPRRVPRRASRLATGYSAEITTILGGWGLEGLLGSRSPVLSGIVNGIDDEE